MKTKILILFFSLIGFFVSMYLYLNRIDSSFCAFGGCNSVLNSKFSKILGIDNSLLGIVYFSIATVLAYLNKDKFLKILLVAGAIFALYLIIVMLFILKEICYYCLAVDLSAIIIFIIIFAKIRCHSCDNDFRKYFQKIFRG
jgi:uncharacterized membrane protein